MRLGVNVDHVATVRQARLGHLPDPIAAARVCLQAGADGIVCHLREDRRHIQDRDVARLRTTFARRLNLEMSIAPSIVSAALRIRPHQVTLVPEHRRELTTEGGLDVVRLSTRLGRVVTRFQEQGIDVSLFIDPVIPQIRAAARSGARIVELHTGRYAEARTTKQRSKELTALRRATKQARALQLRVAAGHGLDYRNVKAVAAIRGIEELNIGFAIIARALFVGIEAAVREIKALVRGAP